MSKLIKALKRNSSPQPMGFKTARETTARTRLLVVASLSEVSGKLAENLKGASALLVTPEMKAPQLKAVAEAAADIPWGCSLGSRSEDGMAAVIKAGADFVTFQPDAPLKTLPERETGRVLEVSVEAAEKLPRAVNESPVDAVYFVAARGSEPLTWQHLMLTRVLASWLSKPLLVSVPDEVNGDELQALWDAGAAGIVALATSGNIARLRKSVDKLEYPARHKAEEKPVIPQVGFSAADAEDEEEDENW